MDSNTFDSMSNFDSTPHESMDGAQHNDGGGDAAPEGTGPQESGPQDSGSDDSAKPDGEGSESGGPQKKKRSRRGGRRRRGKRGAGDEAAGGEAGEGSEGDDTAAEGTDEGSDAAPVEPSAPLIAPLADADAGASGAAPDAGPEGAGDGAGEDRDGSEAGGPRKRRRRGGRGRKRGDRVEADGSESPQASPTASSPSSPLARGLGTPGTAAPGAGGRGANDRGPSGRGPSNRTPNGRGPAPRGPAVRPILNDDDEWGEAPLPGAVARASDDDAGEVQEPATREAPREAPRGRRGPRRDDAARVPAGDDVAAGEGAVDADGPAELNDDRAGEPATGDGRRGRRGGRGRRGRASEGELRSEPRVEARAEPRAEARGLARSEPRTPPREEAKKSAFTGSSKMLINYVPGEECRVAILENGKLEELHVERASAVGNVGNIYVGKVMNVEPAIQAAFIDYGMGENGFLHVTDLHPRYFPGEERNTERVGIKTPRRDRPPIQAALRRGDEIIVQVLKEGVGTKGPSLTGYLSIPGRFLVMMPYMDKVGVSRKVEDEDQRRQMRDILDQLELPEGFGFILRTAGMERTKAELKRDLAYLQRLWKDMDRRLKAGGKPRLLYSESDLLVRALRDLLTSDIDEIIIDNDQALQRAARFLKIVAPRNAPKLLHYTDATPMFHMFDVESQISLMHAREVPLPSGGRLVIDQTEALVAIDVNSGKSRDSRDSETNAFQTNIEAVDEICRQLRLRDMGGIVINDLIDMRDPRHRRDIEQRFKDRMHRDRAKSTVLPISEFGILQMTRQRMRPSHESVHFAECPHCRGRGLLQKPGSVCADALRDLSALLNVSNVQRVELVVSGKIAGELLSGKRQMLSRVERSAGKRVDVRVSESVAPDRVMFYAFDGNGSDIDLSNLQRPKRNATLVEWVDPDLSRGAGDDDDEDSTDLPELPELQDLEELAPREPADVPMDDLADEPESLDDAVHPIELDLPSDVEPDRDGWGAPPVPTRSRGGRRGGRALRSSDEPAAVRSGRAQSDDPERRFGPRPPRAEARVEGRGEVRPEARREERTDGPRDGWRGGRRDDRDRRDGPRDMRRDDARGSRPAMNDDDEWGEPPTRAPQNDLVAPSAQPEQRDVREPGMQERSPDGRRGGRDDRSGGWRDGNREGRRDGRGDGRRDGRGDGRSDFGNAGRDDQPRRYNDDDEWGEPPLPAHAQSGQTAPPRAVPPVAQASAPVGVSQSDGDGPDQGIDEGDERGANEPRAQDGFGDEGPGEGGKRRRRRRRRGRGGDRPEGGFDDRAPMDARPDGVPGAAPEARTGGPAGNASRFAGQRPDHRAPALRDDSDEWGEAATPSGAARSAPMKPAPAASTRDGASEPHAETGAEPDGVEEADASAQDARSDDDGKPGRRRGRRGRRGGRGEDVRAELGDNAPAAREPKLIEPTVPVVNVAQAKATEAKLPEAKPVEAKAAEPKQAISPLARGVGPAPQTPAPQTPAAAQPPRTLYAGRRGKAPPGKGPRRNEDR